MKLSDLRIGNYVSINYPRSGWTATKIQSVNTEFIVTNVEHYFFFKDGLIKGEVLTEKWYENFGFEKISENQYRILYSHPKINTHFKFSYFLNSYNKRRNHLIFHGNVGEPDYSPSIDGQFMYVHQLQNLFHALTGTELI